jgi:transcriptional regulator with XRE-family HTH domain
MPKVPRGNDLDGTPQGVFGNELRFYRERADLSQTELAALVNVSHDVISKIETGNRPPAERFPERLDATSQLDTRDGLARIWGNLRKGLRNQAVPGWFRPWAEIEAEAVTLHGGADSTAGDRERADAPQFWYVLDEAVLHRCLTSKKAMHDQLIHLAELAELPKVGIQVIPSSAGAHAGLLGAFVIADMEGSPSMVYLETSAEGQVTDSPATVAHTRYRFDSLRSEALPRPASRALILKIAEEECT